MKENEIRHDSPNLANIKCDRCGKPAEFLGEGGNCPECGDDLDIHCAGNWTELAENDEPGFAVCDQCLEKIKNDSLHPYHNRAKFSDTTVYTVIFDDKNVGMEAYSFTDFEMAVLKAEELVTAEEELAEIETSECRFDRAKGCWTSTDGFMKVQLLTSKLDTGVWEGTIPG